MMGIHIFWRLILAASLLRPVSAQEGPAFSVPQFANDTSLKVRQDVCDQFLQYDRGEVELRSALAGLELRPLIMETGFLDSEGKLEASNPGLMVVLLDELATRAGFTWRKSFATTPLLGPNSTKTFTELLVWGADYFDVFVGQWDKTLSRLKLGISFPEGFYDSSWILVGVADPPKDTSIDLWQWLEPFDPAVWICIAVTIVFSGVIFQILDYIPTKATQRSHTHTFNEDRRDALIQDSSSGSVESTSATPDASEALYEGAHTVGDGLFLSSLLFTQHFQFIPRTAPSRLFSVSLSLWALLISSNYTANLASFFVIDNTPTLDVQSIDDAIRAGYPICIWGSAASGQYIRQTYPQAVLVETNNDADEMFAALRNGDCRVGVSSSGTFQLYQDQKTVNPDCNVIWVGRTIKFVPAGFGVKADAGTLCSSLINEVLNLHLVEMEAEGVLAEFWKDEMAKSHDQNCAAQFQSDPEGDSGSRSIQEMAGTFVIHLIFTVAAILLMVSGRLYDWFQGMSDESRNEFLARSSLMMRKSTASTASPRSADSLREENKENQQQEAREEMHPEEKEGPGQPRVTRRPQTQEKDSSEDRLQGLEERLEAMEGSSRRRQEDMDQKLDILVKLLQNQQQMST